MAKLSFAAQIEDWTHKVEGAAEAIFKKSAEEVARQMDQILVQMVYDTPQTPAYKRTGFLQASMLASTSAMPTLHRPNPGAQATFDFGVIEAVIAGSELGQTIFVGYTAEYAGHVAFGANGQAPRPWVAMAAQRWSSIVEAQSAVLKQRLGL